MSKKYFIDVREPHEFTEGHVKDAINLPLSKLSSSPHQVLKDIPINEEVDIIVYCRSGGRAGVAISIMSSFGYKKLTNGINKQTVERLYV